MNKINILILFSFLLLVSCDPTVEDKQSLGDPPTNVSFDISELGENVYQFSNTTSGTFIHQWNFGDGSTGEGTPIEHLYTKAGVYDVELTAFNDGGFAKVTGQVTVDEDLGITCETFPTLQQLTNCDSKVWKLDDGEGALFVGPDPGETWWQSAEDEGASRPCAWNDEWIFFEDGTMVYDTKGDLWAEDYMGFDFECVSDGDLSETVAPWASGTHSFEVLEAGTGFQLTLRGLGAFVGLPKVINGAEVTLPVDAVTYEIVEITNDGTKDVMLLEINFGPGIWRYRLKSE